MRKTPFARPEFRPLRMGMLATQATSYANLDEEEKDKVKMILYIMGRFSISLDGYHELTQTQQELPRTHF